MGDTEPTFFVMDTQVSQYKDSLLVQYSWVQLPFEKMRRAMEMQDDIEAQKEKIEDLREDVHQNFGSSVYDEISDLEIRLSEMEKNMNEYLAENAVSFLSLCEKSPVATFEVGDGIGKSALEDMVKKGVLEPIENEQMGVLV